MTALILALLTLSAYPVANAAESPLPSKGDEIQIISPWARPGVAGGTTAVYFTLRNESGQVLNLIGVEAEGVQIAELHETRFVEMTLPNGLTTSVMRMERIPVVAVDPGTSVDFEPGGLHVMLIGLREALSPGDEVSLRLDFADREPLYLTVPVRGDMGADDHDHHHPGEGSHDHGTQHEQGAHHHGHAGS